MPSSGSSHLLLTVHAIRAAQLHATLIAPQSTLMYVGEKAREVLVKSEEQIQGDDGGGKKREGKWGREMRGEKSGIAATGWRREEKRRLVERGRKTGLVVSTRRTLTSH